MFFFGIPWPGQEALQWLFFRVIDKKRGGRVRNGFELGSALFGKLIWNLLFQFCQLRIDLLFDEGEFEYDPIDEYGDVGGGEDREDSDGDGEGDEDGIKEEKVLEFVVVGELGPVVEEGWLGECVKALKVKDESSEIRREIFHCMMYL